MKSQSKRSAAVSYDFAQEIAIDALTFLASDTDRLEDLFSTTGLDPHTLRMEANQPSTHAAILEHILQDESLLLVFSTSTGYDPEDIAPAQEILADQAQE